MERLSRAESTVIAAGLLLAAALILYHAFDAQPLDPVIEPFSASSTFAAAEQASAAPATEQKPPASTIEAAQQPETRSGPSKAAVTGQQRSGPINLNTATREELMTSAGLARSRPTPSSLTGRKTAHSNRWSSFWKYPVLARKRWKSACAGLRVNFWRMLQLSVIPIHLKK